MQLQCLFIMQYMIWFSDCPPHASIALKWLHRAGWCMPHIVVMLIKTLVRYPDLHALLAISEVTQAVKLSSSSSMVRCYCCRQLVGQLSATAPFPWLQPRHGTVCHHRSGLPVRYQLSGVKPRLIFSVSLMADLNLSILLFCSALTELGHVFLTFNF